MPGMNEPEQFEREFESRKADHIRLALESRMQAEGGSGLDRVHLIHEAFPELDFHEVELSVPLFKDFKKNRSGLDSADLVSPLFVSSMTAGHAGSLDLNLVMAKVSEKRNWAMGVGSQRRQLTDPQAASEWRKIRKVCPRIRFFGNIGAAQLIATRVDEIRALADSLEASAMIVHANPLQECFQPEGTPSFKGALKAIERLASELECPVIVKETGSGFSRSTLERLRGLGIAAVDVAGLGGTHWGRIEGGRSKPGDKLQQAAETFRNWGIGTVDSVLAALETGANDGADYEVWASGGVRTGLDAAKLLAMGARLVGFAKPVIEAALGGEEALDKRMELLEFELKTALFCTGSRTVAELQGKRTWHLENSPLLK